MKYKIVLLLTASLLFATYDNNKKQKGTVIWDSDSKASISQKEYNDIILDYVKSKYPQKVKVYKKRSRKKLIKDNTLMLDNLMWQDNLDVESVERNWQGAKDYCKNLSLVGYSDWRLGNKDELTKLYEYKHKLKYFSSNLYWSSTSYEGYSHIAWIVYFDCGDVSNCAKNSYGYVRCVRDGQ